jgi:hypothetical protein
MGDATRGICTKDKCLSNHLANPATPLYSYQNVYQSWCSLLLFKLFNVVILCQVTQSAQHFATLKPLLHPFAFAELFGNNEAVCGIYSIDGSIEGGHPTTFKEVPFDAYIVVLEGSSPCNFCSENKQMMMSI